MQKIYITLFWCIFVSNIVCGQETNDSAKKEKVLFDAIKNFALQIEVFPVDIWAWNPKGPIGIRANDAAVGASAIRWLYRYDLTYERYVHLHDFKERISKVSLIEIDDCLAKIDEATAREKALILTLLFIFERIHRPKPQSIKRNVITPVFPRKPIHNVKDVNWSRLIKVIEKYKEDMTVAFPAISVRNIENSEIEKDWRESFNQCCEKYEQFGLILYKNEIISGHWAEEKIKFLNQFSEDRTLIILREYFYTIFGDGTPSGIGPAIGNSSATPKTLGDIATQLLMSRLPYEGNNK